MMFVVVDPGCLFMAGVYAKSQNRPPALVDLATYGGRQAMEAVEVYLTLPHALRAAATRQERLAVVLADILPSDCPKGPFGRYGARLYDPPPAPAAPYRDLFGRSCNGMDPVVAAALCQLGAAARCDGSEASEELGTAAAATAMCAPDERGYQVIENAAQALADDPEFGRRLPRWPEDAAVYLASI